MALLALVLTASIQAQTADPVPSDSVVPANEPALPTDPTVPSSVPSVAAPANPLIPAPLAPGLEPPPRPTAPDAHLVGVGFPPSVLPADPLALPATAPATPGVTTTNNIGTARRFQYAFAFTLGATYDDNIFLEPAATRSDLYFTIQPSISLGFGGGEGGGGDNFVRFSYSPQALLYTDHDELDTVQQFVSLTGTYRFARLTLHGSQDVQILDSTDVGNPHPFSQNGSTTGNTVIGDGTNPGSSTIINNPVSNVNLDVGQRTRLNLYNTSVTANYNVSDKLSYDLSGQLSISDYAGQLLSSRTLSGSGFFNYTPTGKTTFGIGVSAGEVFADYPNPDQSFEQGNLRISYVPSSKLVFSGELGLELRQSSDTNTTAVTPIFDLSLAYSPFDGTSVSLAANRQVQTSAVLGGQDYRITGFTLGLNQRFFQKFFARLSVGYSHSEYVATATNVDAGRTDDYFFVQPGLDYNLRDNLTLGGFYSHRESTSTLGNRDFSENQVGMRLSFSF